MAKKTGVYVWLMLVALLFASCGGDAAPASSAGGVVPPTYEGPLREFASSFESAEDFEDFYTVSQGAYDANHSLASDNVYEGSLSHKAWILKARDADNESGSGYLPHRAYPTLQFHKSAGGIYRTPCLVTLYVYLDTVLEEREGIDDWFSFVTLCADSSDAWTRTVLVNLTPDGYLRLVHLPNQGEQEHIYQADENASLLFPYQTWVRLDVYIDFDADEGYAKVWQNGELVSWGNVNGGQGGLAQAHFGLYAAAAVASGSVYNDRLRIKEVANEAEAITLVKTAY